jgi:hypothetical protein
MPAIALVLLAKPWKPQFFSWETPISLFSCFNFEMYAHRKPLILFILVIFFPSIYWFMFLLPRSKHMGCLLIYFIFLYLDLDSFIFCPPLTQAFKIQTSGVFIIQVFLKFLGFQDMEH